MKTIGEIGEFGLIDRIARFGAPSADVLTGIGDDCAVLRLGDRKLLVTTDMAVEGVHFRRDLATPYDIGYKSAAGALSDIAAMGGTPLFFLVSLSCPVDTEIAYIEAMYQGITNLTSAYGVSLVGGDTTRAHDRITLDVQMIGEAKGLHVLRRKGAQAGDLLAITNTVGQSAAGLKASMEGHEVPELLTAHYRPIPRITEGQWLAAHDAVHAMIDISDGLIQDSGHLARINQIGINIETDKLNPSPALSKYCWENNLNPIELMLSGGEDFELAFAVDAQECQSLFSLFKQEIRTPLRVIGRFTHEWTGVRVDGQPTNLHGFDHFSV